jgi:pyruvate formate lyase activating enzyme
METELGGDYMHIEDFSVKVPLEAKTPFELRINPEKNLPVSEVQKSLSTGDIGYLHSFTTGSTVDGPGVRVVAWTSGCQFRCLYCHNPDTWKISNGIAVSIEKATEELGKYRSGLKIMAGGFTLSGGEPLMQDRFAVRLFGAAKKMGIHTALDTNGAFGNRLSDKELEQIDLVLLDIKAWDPALHKRLTGQDIGPVLDFAARLAFLKKPVWLRYVLVPNLTDNPEDISKIAEFAAELGNIKRTDVLPFHQLGRFKWKELKLKYKLEDLEPPSRESIEQACSQFRAAGLNTF